MYSNKLKSPIADLDVKKRSLLFAELAEIAYKGKTQATKSAKSLGFTTVDLLWYFSKTCIFSFIR